MADASFAACAQGRGLLEGGRPRSPVPSEIRGRGGGGGGDAVPDLVGERVPDVLVGILGREESAGRSQNGWGCSD